MILDYIHIVVNTSVTPEPRLGSDLGSARLVRFFKKLVLKKLAKTSLFGDFSKTLFANDKKYQFFSLQ